MAYIIVIIICYSSYTNFQYSGLSISPTSIAAGDKVVVDVFVSNVGSRDGEEVRILTLRTLLLTWCVGNSSIHIMAKCDRCSTCETASWCQ